MKIVHDDAAGSEPRTAKADAMEFLQAALAGDPVPATEVSRMAHAHSLRTPENYRRPRSDRAGARQFLYLLRQT